MSGAKLVRDEHLIRRSEILGLDDVRWTDLVRHDERATPFHLPAWVSAVADCYRFHAFVLAWKDGDGNVLGGMPVVEVRRPLGRRAWVSLPFTDHCSPLHLISDANWTHAIRSALDAAGVGRLEIRDDVPGERAATVAVRHVLPLSTDVDAVHRGLHRSQVQRNIRRAEREGVTIRVGTQLSDLTEVFYGLHLRTRRRQGVPVQPRRFFGLIWQHLLEPGHGSVLVAEHGGIPVAAAVFLRHNGTVIYKFGASDADAWSYRPNHALFWHAIQTACAQGDREFDWGRTDLENTGLRAFKSAWGAQELPLRYSTLGAAAESTKSHELTDSTAARVLAATIRNSPPWVCTAVGAALYRYTA